MKMMFYLFFHHKSHDRENYFAQNIMHFPIKKGR